AMGPCLVFLYPGAAFRSRFDGAVCSPSSMSSGEPNPARIVERTSVRRGRFPLVLFDGPRQNLRRREEQSFEFVDAEAGKEATVIDLLLEGPAQDCCPLRCPDWPGIRVAGPVARECVNVEERRDGIRIAAKKPAHIASNGLEADDTTPRRSASGLDAD